MGKLDKYIEEQLATGYTSQQLSSFLLTQGYTASDIAKAFSQVHEKHERSRIQNYIYDRERQGATSKNIKQELFQQKFTPAYIREELHLITGGQRHVLSFLVLLALAVSIILTALFLFDFSSDASTLADTSSTPVEFVPVVQPVVSEITDCTVFDGPALQYCVQKLSLEQSDPSLCALSGSSAAHDDCLFAHLHTGETISCEDFLDFENAYLCEHQQNRTS